MSWSVSSKGKPVDVVVSLRADFAGPLAPKPAGLTDDGQRETVDLVQKLIEQCLGTFDSEKVVTVSAYGHMGFKDREKKTGAFQSVTLSITPEP